MKPLMWMIGLLLAAAAQAAEPPAVGIWRGTLEESFAPRALAEIGSWLAARFPQG